MHEKIKIKTRREITFLSWSMRERQELPKKICVIRSGCLFLCSKLPKRTWSGVGKMYFVCTASSSSSVSTTFATFFYWYKLFSSLCDSIAIGKNGKRVIKIFPCQSVFFSWENQSTGNLLIFTAARGDVTWDTYFFIANIRIDIFDAAEMSSQSSSLVKKTQ